MRITKGCILLIIVFISIIISSCDSIVDPADNDVPTNLNIEKISNGKIQISWFYHKINEDTIRFEIAKKIGNEGWIENYAEVEEDIFEFIDHIPTNDVLVYAYKIRYFNESILEYSQYSDVIAYFSEQTYPTDLQIIQTTQTEVFITWIDNCIGEDGYKVDKKINDGEWQNMYGIFYPDITGFADTTTLFDSLFYRVYAYTGISNTEKLSNDIFSTLLSPSNLLASSPDINKVRLNWNDNSEGEDGFYIDRKLGELNWETNYSTVSDSTFLDDILLPCGTLQYRVRAFKNEFTSEYSNIDTINVKLNIVGFLETPGSALDICLPKESSVVPDWTAFIADNYEGLAIVDCQNPTNPQQDYSYNLADRTLSVFIDMNFAYVTTHSGSNEVGEIQKIDITNLEFPVIAGITATEGIPKDLYVDQDYAFIAEGDNGVTIMYVATSQPAEIANFPLQDARNLFIRENDTYLFVANGLYGMNIIDVANPNNPQYIADINTTGLVNDVHGFGNYVYLANGENGLEILDIADESNPISINIIETGGFVNGVHAEQDYVYITDIEKGFYVIDVSDPYNAYILGNVELASSPSSLYLSGSYVYITDEEGLKIIRVKE